jgi:hypothetical protein
MLSVLRAKAPMRDVPSLQSPISKENAKAQAILFYLFIIPRETVHCVQAPVHERGALPSVPSLQGDHSQDRQGGGVQVCKSTLIMNLL